MANTENCKYYDDDNKIAAPPPGERPGRILLLSTGTHGARTYDIQSISELEPRTVNFRNGEPVHINA